MEHRNILLSERYCIATILEISNYISWCWIGLHKSSHSCADRIVPSYSTWSLLDRLVFFGLAHILPGFLVWPFCSVVWTFSIIVLVHWPVDVPLSFAFLGRTHNVLKSLATRLEGRVSVGNYRGVLARVSIVSFHHSLVQLRTANVVSLQSSTGEGRLTQHPCWQYRILFGPLRSRPNQD